VERDKLRKTVTILGSVIAVGIGELMLKYGLNRLGTLDFGSAMIQSFIQVATSPYILTGLALFVMSSLLWLIALSETELSYAYPLLGTGYAIVAFFSWLLFNEALGALRIMGIFVIIAGVAMMSRS
jgi:multidrug transporter EmrE-like cation transporter